MKVSLKDLAQICGCSVTSVSRALKDSDTISKELREKVKSKAQELGYVPNLLAGSMRTGYTNTLAVILPDLRNPYFSLLAKYAEEYATSKGYSVFFMTTNEISEHEHDAVMKAMQKNVDGILLLPNQLDTQSIDIMNKMNFPYVLFGRIFDDIKADSVVVNDEMGGYLATKHLIEKGHSRILFLNSFMHIFSSQARFREMCIRDRSNTLRPYLSSVALTAFASIVSGSPLTSMPSTPISFARLAISSMDKLPKIQELIENFILFITHLFS